MRNYQETADRIAALVESDGTPVELVNSLCHHVKEMAARADLTRPATIRRLYPILAEIVAEDAAAQVKQQAAAARS